MMDIEALRKRHQELVKKSDKLAEARFNLPAGSSRSKVTTANAKWARVAEERDRVGALIAKAEAA